MMRFIAIVCLALLAGCASSRPLAQPIAAVGRSTAADALVAVDAALAEALAAFPAGRRPDTVLVFDRRAVGDPAAMVARIHAAVPSARIHGQGGTGLNAPLWGGGMVGGPTLQIIALAGLPVTAVADGGAILEATSLGVIDVRQARLAAALRDRLAGATPALVLLFGGSAWQHWGDLGPAFHRQARDWPLLAVAGRADDWVIADGHVTAPGRLAVALGGPIRVGLGSTATINNWDLDGLMAGAEAAAATAARQAPRAFLAIAWASEDRYRLTRIAYDTRLDPARIAAALPGVPLAGGHMPVVAMADGRYRPACDLVVVTLGLEGAP
jgi:hypothetical protein